MYGFTRYYDRYSRMVERLVETASEQVRQLIRDKIPSHPATKKCKDAECEVCGMRDCPYDDPLHYHRDGCPTCYWNLFTEEQEKM